MVGCCVSLSRQFIPSHGRTMPVSSEIPDPSRRSWQQRPLQCLLRQRHKPPPNNTTRFTNAFPSLATLSSWLIVVCFVVDTMRPLTWSRGTTLFVRSPATATASTSLKMSSMAVACQLLTRQLHRRIPLPCNVVIVVDCCVFLSSTQCVPSREHDAPSTLGTTISTRRWPRCACPHAGPPLTWWG